METEVLGRGARPASDTDGVLLTVPDRAIREVSNALQTRKPVLHCSGALNWTELRPREPVGWFHPLMTFPGPEIHLPPLDDVPIAIGGDPSAHQLALALAQRLGAKAVEVTGDVRLYHCAAVMAGNFSTLLIQTAARCMEGAGVAESDAREWLRPLMQASIDNAIRAPQTALTGPAVRGDDATIEAHLSALKASELTEVIDLYQHLTRHIKSSASD